MARPDYRRTAGIPDQQFATVKIFVAVRLADKYHSRIPSPDELQNEFDMDRATAYRWVNAFKAARGVQ